MGRSRFVEVGAVPRSQSLFLIQREHKTVQYNDIRPNIRSKKVV